MIVKCTALDDAGGTVRWDTRGGQLLLTDDCIACCQSPFVANFIKGKLPGDACDAPSAPPPVQASSNVPSACCARLSSSDTLVDLSMRFSIGARNNAGQPPWERLLSSCW